MKNKYIGYLPGILLFVVALIVAFLTYKDYGISWDELDQRKIGTLTYNYISNGNTDLFNYTYRWYGTGYELPLIYLEKWFGLTDSQAVYFMRHLVTHILYLLSALAVYVIIFRSTRNMIVASICFLMMVLMPRIYAHSFFNTKDIPFLCLYIITLAIAQVAFDKNKLWLYGLMGAVTGYTTSIRVMGIMMFAFLLGMLLLDLLNSLSDKEAKKKALINTGLYVALFCLTLVGAWPLLWKGPVSNFLEAYSVMSHYNWPGMVLLRGKDLSAIDLPADYFPTWFVLTTPLLWIALGVVGAGFVLKNFFKNLKGHFLNSDGRNFMLALCCFIVPVFAVVALHAVIYDDWRHLYFVYPPFVLLAGYGINMFINGKFKWVVISVCALQMTIVAYFMFKNHPFQEVYFNELTSTEEEYLRENYELDYWGCSFKQGLEYLVKKHPTDTIKVGCNIIDPVHHNLSILPPADRARIVLYDSKHAEEADYFITNFRERKYDYPSKNVEHEIKVLNSTIMCIYYIKEKTPAQPGK